MTQTLALPIRAMVVVLLFCGTVSVIVQAVRFWCE